MKLSIIITTYNYGDYISRAIISAVNQDIDKEIIIVDDGSTDNTEEVVLSLVSQYQFIKYIKKSNGGVSSARNVGINECSGDYVVFLDADDNFIEGAIAKVFDRIQHEDVVICDYVSIAGSNKKIKSACKVMPKLGSERVKGYFSKKISISMGASIYSSEFIRKFRFNEKVKSSEDIPLFVLSLLQDKVEYTPVEVVAVNHHEGSMRKQSWRVIEYSYDAIDELFSNVTAQYFLQDMKGWIYSRRALSNFRTCYLAGDFTNARKFYMDAIRFYKWSVFDISYLKKFLKTLFRK